MAGLSVWLLLLGCGASASNGDAASTPNPKTSPSSLLQRPPPEPTKPTSTFVAPPLTPWPTAAPGDFTAQVVWQGDQLVVTAFGSSLCRPVARSVAAVDAHTLLVTFDIRPANVGCTDDFAPHRSRLPAPNGGIDLESDVYAAFNLDGAARQLIPVQLRHPAFG